MDAPQSEQGKGFVLETDDGEVEVGLDEIQRMADDGEPAGLYALGMAYLFGVQVKQDSAKGYDLLEQAAKKDNPEAKALLVKMFFDGDYMGIDTAQAVAYAEDAAAAGIADGQLYYGIALMDGAGMDQADPAAAAEQFRAAAKQGNAEARNSLAYLYLEGEGVAKDEVKAFKLFKNAASAGNVNAQYQTGVCYETGCGCAKDFPKARLWYEKAAAQGDGEAMDRLGMLYFNGADGFKKDPQQSFEWFLKAAGQGLPDSMYTVGCYYADGYGTKKDLLEAKKWLQLAKDNGHQTAAELLDRLEREEPPQ